MKIRPSLPANPSARPDNKDDVVHLESSRPFRQFFKGLLYWKVTLVFSVFAMSGVILASADRANVALPFGVKNWLDLPQPTANLDRQNHTRLPEDWPERDIDMRRYFAEWCNRPDTIACPLTPSDTMHAIGSDQFQREYLAGRSARLDKLDRISLSNKYLVGASFLEAGLEGVSFKGSNLTDAIFESARLEGADFSRAVLDGSDFSLADLRNAKFTLIAADAISFQGANLEGADIWTPESRLLTLDVSSARLNYARLRGTFKFVFDVSKEEGRFSEFAYTDFRMATINDTVIFGTGQAKQFEGMRIDRPFFSQLPSTWALKGSALIRVNLSEIALPDGNPETRERIMAEILAGTMGDPSTVLPEGIQRPCHWPVSLDDSSEATFLDVWRAWNARKIVPGTDLLPPLEICTIDTCDCEAVMTWRETQG